MLEPVPVLNEGSPSPIRSTSQLRLVPDPVAVTIWPGVKVLPCAGEIIAVDAGDVIVRAKLVVFVIPPPVPVTVIVEVPGGVEPLVLTVSVEEQLRVQLAEEKEAVAPLGRPEVEKETA
jgi:hypothetical protein